jgi:hypothetical protein
MSILDMQFENSRFLLLLNIFTYMNEVVILQEYSQTLTILKLPSIHKHPVRHVYNIRDIRL